MSKVEFIWKCTHPAHLWRNVDHTNLWECVYCHSVTNQFPMTWDQALHRMGLDSDGKKAGSGKVARKNSIKTRANKPRKVHTLAYEEMQDEVVYLRGKVLPKQTHA